MPRKKITEPQVAMKPEDETGADSAPENKGKRKAVSKREFINVNGGEAEKVEDSAGGKYTLLGEGGESFEYIFGQNETADKCFAIFGFHTKVGNVANTVLNGEDAGTPAMAADEIREFLANLNDNGVWAERTGGVGARVDKDALAGAVVEVAEAAGKTADYAAIRKRLEEEPAYFKLVRQVDKVAMAYARRVGKVSKTIDDILSA